MAGLENIIPYGRQWVTPDDISEVMAALASDWLTQGPRVAEFEDSLASYCGAKYAVAVSNGTAALHLACLALELDKGADVVTSPNTFLASANCALYSGLHPRFADIDPDTCNIDPARLEEALKNKKKKVKAVIPVHFGGNPCDMLAISAIAREHGAHVIEDACHALGAGTKKRGGGLDRTGSCKYSDMTVFSFHPVKHITTGEGGAVLTNSRKLYDRLNILRNHGMTRDPKRMTRNPGPWYYEMVELGYNYRITDLQCALGTSQMKRLDDFVARRREIAARYDNAFKDMEFVRPLAESPWSFSSYHLYVLRADFKSLKKSRKKVIAELLELGVRTQVHYIPVHLQPYYIREFGYRPGDFPVAEAYYESALSIPMFPMMAGKDVGRVIAAVRSVLA
ncbi:MAG: UDP-4-amino-4,6-dideoxy-N-acetyl-beta-L-altrosamine transaminase [Nitrospirae bacterium]|nr:UDP-4-amino-4,6-dideoxy-N-acetyl-beta-L-altrosamine transaminase [Nitrospirota bacterium]